MAQNVGFVLAAYITICSFVWKVKWNCNFFFLLEEFSRATFKPSNHNGLSFSKLYDVYVARNL